jgi:hypothetical protein
MYYPDLQAAKKMSPLPSRRTEEMAKRKPYRFPKQYVNYQTFLEIVVFSQIAKASRVEFDPTTALFYAQCSLWDIEDIPIYGLSQDTLQLFQESKIDNNKDFFENLPESQVTKYCILLPSGVYPTSADGYIELLWIDSIRNTSTEPIDMSRELGGVAIVDRVQGKSQRIVTSAIDTNEVTYCTFADYPKLELKIGNIEAGELADDTLDIITRLRDLALQIVMAIEFLPEAISLDLPVTATNKGFSKRSPTANNFWQIRKVEIERKRYIVRQRAERGESEGARKSPRPHFRKWHWRRVAVGTEGKGREWRLIPNTYVNPEG